MNELRSEISAALDIILDPLLAFQLSAPPHAA
jgi:hypothetical protein